MTTEKVLVLGEDTRSFLATVRSLGRAGVTVHAAPANFRSPALHSRYIAGVHRLAPWISEPAEWLSAISALIRAERFDCVIPCNETTLLPLQRHRASLSSLTRLAIPDDASIAVLFDKAASRECAQSLNVPVAAGRLLSASDTPSSLSAEFDLPLVVKPRRSYTLESLATRGKASVARTLDELASLLAGLEPEQTLIEKFFDGQGVGVSVLARDGRLLQSFQHRRVREFAGSSFYRVSEPPDTTLVGHVASIVGALRYTGLAMFEFKCNDAGQSVLLEVNARPWGSMPLPLALGIDFPYRWYRLLTQGSDPGPVGYRSGVYGRNLLPDLFQSFAGRKGAGKLVSGLRVALGRTLELRRVAIGREVQDVLVADDPLPALFEMAAVWPVIRQRLRSRLRGASNSRQPGLSYRQTSRLSSCVGRPRIVFVCSGNICRSPFAAAVLRKMFGTDGPLVVESAGTMPAPGRGSPSLAVSAGAAFDIDLAAHRSIWLSRPRADAATLLVVFEEANRSAILDWHPKLRTPIIRLGDFDRAGDIADPIDGGPEAFRACYARIERAVVAFAEFLQQERTSFTS